jgi:hypothetical protein
MYQHAPSFSNEELKEQVADANGKNSDVELRVTVAKTSRVLRFVGKHIFDLQVVLKTSSLSEDAHNQRE